MPTKRISLWLAIIAVPAVLLLGVILALFAQRQLTEPPETTLDVDDPKGVSIADGQALARANPGFLYGRVTTDDGAAYEGRLRWGRDEEAFWGDYFNGAKVANPWAARVPPDQAPKSSGGFEIFGIAIGRSTGLEVKRPFLARFGDIARIEAPSLTIVRVTLQSGTAYDLDYLEATDFADDVRVWDADRGVVTLKPRHIRRIELLPTARLGRAPTRLHGTVRTSQGDFTGFLQWDRPDGSHVAFLDGRELDLSGNDRDRGNRGVYVDDVRYGRVLIAWSALQRVDLSPGGSGPAYGDFPPGRALTGRVTTTGGGQFAGRLVFDLDESETTDTLDGSGHGVDYTVPFGLVSSIALPNRKAGIIGQAEVKLHNGEALTLEPRGDLGENNAGLLIFSGDGQRTQYVPWKDVAAIAFDGDTRSKAP